MSPIRTTLTIALLTTALAAAAQTTPADPPAPKSKSMQELLDGSKPSDWRGLDPARTLYMDFAAGRVFTGEQVRQMLEEAVAANGVAAGASGPRE